MKILKSILLICICLSLLLIPYSIIAYACYIGLCGGSEAYAIGKKYATFYGYFSWVYFMVVISSLYFSKIYKNKNQASTSLFILLIPLFCLLPYFYVSYDVSRIHADYERQRINYYSPTHEDYICNPDIFFKSKDNAYYIIKHNADFSSTSMIRESNIKDLEDFLDKNNLSISICKNSQGKNITVK